jgi:hypothetical protein
MVTLDKPWEVGSEFHWLGMPRGPFLTWPEPCVMLASGREALLNAWRALPDRTAKFLFVPDYFCAEVVSWWEQRGVPTKCYTDGPHREAPDWNSLAVSPGDMVLAVNYFGVREGRMWDSWRSANDRILFVEDHSHDPLSTWALNSAADYAFASLRKTFPAPDGAILWSPVDLPLPAPSSSGNWRGSALKLAAMVLKKDYLGGGGEPTKKAFREFQKEGEKAIIESQNESVSPWSRYLLSLGYPTEWRDRREKNITLLLTLLEAHPVIKPLFTRWPAHHCPFNAVLMFPSNAKRAESRQRLMDAGVYPAVHWELGRASAPDSLDVSERILTIPADQRYGEEEMKRVASLLLDES